MRPTTAARREAAYAAFLTLVLSAGVLGVLLLNTAMQQQALTLARSHARLAELAGQLQTLQTQLDWTSDPAALADRAHRLRLRPVKEVQYLRLTEKQRRTTSRGRDGTVSGRTPATGPGREG